MRFFRSLRWLSACSSSAPARSDSSELKSIYALLIVMLISSGINHTVGGAIDLFFRGYVIVLIAAAREAMIRTSPNRILGLIAYRYAPILVLRFMSLGLGLVGRMAKTIQAATHESVGIAFVDQGLHRQAPRHRCRGARYRARRRQTLRGQAQPRAAAAALGRRALLCLGHPFPKARQGLEQCAQTFADLHIVAFVCIMLKKVA